MLTAVATEDEAARRMVEVGNRLAEARERKGISKRAAAAAAGFSEITWRSLEAGVRNPAKGVVVPISPRDETLEAAALAVGLDPAELFELAGRPYRSASEVAPNGEVHIASHDVDLDELRDADPVAYESLMNLAQAALERARQNRG